MRMALKSWSAGAAAAAGGGVLGDEDGMASHGGLLSVVARRGGGEAGENEVFGVAADGVGAFFADVGAVGGRQAEAAPEGGFRQAGEEGVKGRRHGEGFSNDLKKFSAVFQ